MSLIGSQIVSKALQHEGADTFFYIMGGPMMDVELSAMEYGLRGVDVRHEQAAAMMAHAYARLLNKPGICMGASGPGTTNLITGVAHAWADCTPVIALGGSSPHMASGRGVFQEIDQLTMFEPCTKHCDRIYDARRIPEYVNRAFELAMAGKPGPVYLDLPGDVLYQSVEESDIEWPEPWTSKERHRPAASSNAVNDIVEALAKAEKPVILTGSGIQWSAAETQLQAFVEQSGIPFYTTPQARGVVPEDHEYSYLTARGTAFREADLIVVIGTRMNYIIGHAAPPRFSAEAKVIRIDIEPEEIAASPRLDLGVVADAKTALEQLLSATQGKTTPDTYRAWRERLAGRNTSKQVEQEAILKNSATPIHPLRLCSEVADILDRDAVLVVDGQEILNYGRQSIPTFTARHRINSGCFGTMGIGLPCAVGAKVAKPDNQVVVLHGDGSFGLNAMELDTAVRHNIPVLVVISLNGGWTGDPDHSKPGRDLGYTRYDKMAEALGCYAELVEEPDEIGPALRRAQAQVDKGRVALVNVKTDFRARATTTAFTRYTT
ncbi:MAG: thiamine pyrophosphate-binding protein [Gammaproteobacteria bacterium]|nr:thiamine pyrophosphate-binding protein [Gammaproteobacteria bacterium]